MKQVPFLNILGSDRTVILVDRGGRALLRLEATHAAALGAAAVFMAPKLTAAAAVAALVRGMSIAVEPVAPASVDNDAAA